MGVSVPAPQFEGLVAQAWRSFERAAPMRCRVSPAVPILFFGDLDAYCRSPTRILTVGLNPSLEEFPSRRPFRRFPLASTVTPIDPERYIRALSAYFRTDPYDTWFRNFEPLLNGANASYYPRWASTVLHTDICSPVATDPTWSRLADSDRAALEVHGPALWYGLVEELKPHIVVLSVARRYLSRIVFDPVSRWKPLHRFEFKDSGAPRSRPYEARARWYRTGGNPTLFVHCPAGRTPLTISTAQKRQLGAMSLQAWRRGH